MFFKCAAPAQPLSGFWPTLLCAQGRSKPCYVLRSPCHVVYTDFRPTPLQHYAFPSGGDGLYMVVDERGTFRQDNFAKAVAALTDAAAEAASAGAGAALACWVAVPLCVGASCQGG